MEKRAGADSRTVSKIRVIYIVFALILIAVLAKIVFIQQGDDGDQLRAEAVESNFKNEILPATRGNILSDDGRILATSVPYYEIRMDMLNEGLSEEYLKQNIGALADSLSRFFKDKSSAEYRRDILEARKKGNRYYRVNRRKINYIELQRVEKFPIFDKGQYRGCFIAEKVERRVNTYGKLAARTIGFTNEVGDKVGIEGGFEELLRGTDGVTMMQKVSGKFWVPVASPTNIEPQNGFDVVTTINIELQSFVQEALADRIREIDADWGTVVVMETATGQIKAIANATKIDNGQIVEDYNYAIGMSQEPGSTFKMAVLLALLGDAKASVSERFNTEGGHAQIGHAVVTDVSSYGELSLMEAFEKSSNIGMAKAVNKYYSNRPAKFVEALTKMGIDKPLGLPISGETSPTFKHPKNRREWDGTTLTMMSYGYALKVTPLQTLNICNTIANDGKMVRPQLIKELIHLGDTIKHYETEVINPEISDKNTVALMQRAMEGVVLNGTGRVLQNPLYRVAAKTGTAQIAVGRSGYKDRGGRHYLGSIAGYFPAENPQYSIVVAIKTFRLDGSTKLYYGGAVTTPLFRKIADHVVKSQERFAKPIYPRAVVLDRVLEVKEGERDQLYTLLNRINIVSNKGNIENARHKLRSDTTRNITQSGREHLTAIDPALDVIGFTITEAIAKLERKGYTIQSSGRGVVVKQEVDTLRVVRLILK